MRTNLRPSARAIERPSEVLPTPGGPTKHRIGPFSTRPRSRELEHAEVLEDAILDVLEAVVILVEDRARLGQIELVVGGDRPTAPRPATRGRCAARPPRRSRGSPARGGAAGDRPRRAARPACARVSICARSSSSSPLPPAPPPSSDWICRSCSRRKYSRCALRHLLLGARLDRRLHLEDLDLLLQDGADLAQPLDGIHLLEQRLPRRRPSWSRSTRPDRRAAPDPRRRRRPASARATAACPPARTSSRSSRTERMSASASGAPGGNLRLVDALDRHRVARRLLARSSRMRARIRPCTSTLMRPSESLRMRMIMPTVPKRWMPVGRRLVLGLVGLRAQQHQAILGGERLVDGGDRHLARHHQRHDHVREDHQIADGQQRQRRRDLERLLDGAVG